MEEITVREENYFTITDVNQCMFRNHCDKFGSDVCTWQCHKMDGMNYLMSLSNLPLKYKRPQKLQTDCFRDDALAEYLDYILSNPEFFVDQGYNAYFYGPVGSGKTSWAVQCLIAYFAAISPKNGHNVSGLFVNAPKLLKDIKFHMTHKSENFKELIETLEVTKLVVWDDILQTDPTAFESQWIYSLINSRLMNGLSNIYTSNISPEQLQNIDIRLHSRVCEESDCLYFDCPDMRGSHKYSDHITYSKNYFKEHPEELQPGEFT